MATCFKKMIEDSKIIFYLAEAIERRFKAEIVIHNKLSRKVLILAIVHMAAIL